MLIVVPSFVDDLLWPEYNQLAEALREYLDEATERIIREAVFKDEAEAEAR
jgi:tRNA nucleotidyltransferase (CCA-adding enzyme)